MADFHYYGKRVVPGSILYATAARCIAFQNQSAKFYKLQSGDIAELAVQHQETARHYHDEAWERLSRILGIS